MRVAFQAGIKQAPTPVGRINTGTLTLGKHAVGADISHRIALQFRKIANMLASSTQNECHPLPGRGRIMPVPGVVQRIAREGAGQVLYPIGAIAGDGPRTPTAGGRLPARRDLRTPCQFSGSASSDSVLLPWCDSGGSLAWPREGTCRSAERDRSSDRVEETF